MTRKRPPSTQHNYTRKLAQFARKKKIPKGQLQHVDIAHDDWCDMLQDEGFCNCSPEFRIRPFARPDHN
ncbi:MAG: hypothetical protein ABGZ23_07245 [Fuerstiella sp.]